MKIVTIGAGMRDMFLAYQHPEQIHCNTVNNQTYIMLETGSKIPIAEIQYHTGGGATNSAIAFKKLDFSVESFFKVGSDDEGTFIINALKAKKINVSHVQKSSKVATGSSCIIPAHTGNFAILAYRGANLTLTEKEIPQESITSCDQLYVTSLSQKTSELLPIITKLAKQHEKHVACNPGSSQLTANIKTLEDSLPFIDVLILNCFEATLLMGSIGKSNKNRSITTPSSFDPSILRVPQDAREGPVLSFVEVSQASHKASPGTAGRTEVVNSELDELQSSLPDLLAAPLGPQANCFTLQDYFETVLKCGPRIAVVTNGADGVYASDGTKIYYHPSLPIEVVSTVGAGDAFGSTFVAQLLKEASIEDAIRCGIINSASAISQLDATSGLVTQKELLRLLAKLNKKLLSTFPLD